MEHKREYIHLWSIAAAEDYYKAKLERGYAWRLYNFFIYAEIGDELIFFFNNEEAARGFCIYGYHSEGYYLDGTISDDEPVFATEGVLSVKRVENESSCYGITLKVTTVGGMTYYVHQYHAYDLRRKAGFPPIRQTRAFVKA